MAALAPPMLASALSPAFAAISTYATSASSSPRLAALHESVTRLRMLALQDSMAVPRATPDTQRDSPEALSLIRAGSSDSALPGDDSDSHMKFVAVPPTRGRESSVPNDAAEAAAKEDENEWPGWGSSSSPRPSSPDTASSGMCMPRSPTIHTRRLVHVVPFRPSANALLFPHASRAELARLSDWSPPSSCASSPGTRSVASSSPFSFHSPLDGGSLLAGKSYLPSAPSTPPPFCPVVPLLQLAGDELELPPVSITPLQRPRQSSTHQPQQLSLTQSHLLQLASSGVTSSSPSSAASSCPPSPDLGGRQASASSIHARPASPFALAAGLSPTSSVASAGNTHSLALHTPDSPTWKGATPAHHSGMELSARRRAREACRGRESIGRLRLVGLSSRAQQAQQAAQQHQLSGSSWHAQHLLQQQHHDGDSDSAGLSDWETPSPLALSPIVTPSTILRRAAAAAAAGAAGPSARTTLSHKVLPLMSSQGQLHTSFSYSAQSDASGNAVSGGHSALLGQTPLGDVEPDVVASYLLQLSPGELVATLQPIRALLPLDPEPHESDFDASTAVPAVEAPAPAISSESAAASLTAVASVASPPPSLQPPLLLSLARLSSAWSPLQLSLAWSRCVARSSWRRAVPSDLLQLSFSFLDVRSLLQVACAVSKYWKSTALSLAAESPGWREAIAQRRAQGVRKRKMRVYRRLTHDEQSDSMLRRMQQEHQQQLELQMQLQQEEE